MSLHYYHWFIDKETLGSLTICLDSHLVGWNSESPTPKLELLIYTPWSWEPIALLLGSFLLLLATNVNAASRAEVSWFSQISDDSIILRPLTCTDLQGVAKDGLSRLRSESSITATESGIGTVGRPWAPSTGSCGKWTSLRRYQLPVENKEMEKEEGRDACLHTRRSPWK